METPFHLTISVNLVIVILSFLSFISELCLSAQKTKGYDDNGLMSAMPISMVIFLGFAALFVVGVVCGMDNANATVVGAVCAQAAALGFIAPALSMRFATHLIRAEPLGLPAISMLPPTLLMAAGFVVMLLEISLATGEANLINTLNSMLLGVVVTGATVAMLLAMCRSQIRPGKLLADHA